MEHAANAAHAAASHAVLPFYQTPEFWVMIAFVAFVVLFGKKIAQAITVSLDERAAKIKAQIEEAARLREEAQATLTAYKRKQSEAMKEAADIVATAKASADRLRAKMVADLEASLKRREQQALDRIAQAEEAALNEVRMAAADLALAATQRLIASSLTAERSNTLIDAAIQDLPLKLH